MILTASDIDFVSHALNNMRGINTNSTLNELRRLLSNKLRVGLDISTLSIKDNFTSEEIAEIKLMIANYVQTAISVNQRLEANKRKPAYTTSYILKTVSATIKKPLGI